MSIKRTRRLLWTAAMVLLIAACAVAVIAGRRSPTLSDAPSTRSVSPSRAGSDPAKSDELTLTAFASHFNRRLQPPLYEPVASAPAAPPAPEPPPLALRLLGTVIEPGNTQAILMTAAGRMRFARIGETVDDAQIQAIEQGKVTTRYHERTVTLTLEGQSRP